MNDPLQETYRLVDETCGDEIVAATVKGLMCGYATMWGEGMASKQIEAMERTYVGPLINPATGKPSRTWRVAGKIDKLVREDGARVLYDHKTTSQDIEDPNAVYWRTLQVDSQHQHYELLLWLNGLKVDRIVWDVIRKPGIRPKKLAKKERQGIVATGTYCGHRISDYSREWYTREERENVELFALRVAAETVENPNRYFARRSVVRTNDELIEYAGELWSTADSMREARNDGTHYRNAGACMAYGVPCQFLGVCSGSDSITSDRWTKKQRRHSELDYDGDGEDLISNSRLRTFLTCRRKAHYQYDLSVERVDAKDKEAIYFGTCMHAALDKFWSLTCRTIGEENGHDISATTGSEPASAGRSHTGLPF
jgi:hypothetical protein